MSRSTVNDDESRSLLVDIGNSNLKWAWLQQGQLSPFESCAYGVNGVAALAYRSWSHAAKPCRVIVANVAGQQIADELQHWVLSEWGIESEFIVAPAQGLGVTNAYGQPEQLGVDRWLALIAARKLTKDHVCVVDCGTAITIDVLAPDGQHLGGLILPGLTMMRQTILDQTQIPFFEASASTGLLAQDTAAAIAAGSLHAAAALVERVMLHMTEPEGITPKLMLTGKDAVRIKEVLTSDAAIEPELVMQGLALVAVN
ncbi:Pantothenate kinase type III, CoaX-like [hydrothermal vent metagenome]|uniref:Type III pantothenate kinase n=1 Tax=hydrothermal vent metagenome TaxID=652676 RepID=A0A3B1ALL7_9ZZZZ